ncbi:MAG: hypothetical protein ACJ8AH_12820 [Stellaceae bacterium]|jgi:hypothetical protein
MRKRLVWLSVMAFFSALFATIGQMAGPAGAATPFDGTYRLVSAANVNATYTTRKGMTASCPSRRAGLLHIENARARYTTATGYRVRGTVGPQGELAMRASGPSSWANQPIDLSVSGTVDASGIARVRQLSHSCSYDFVWQRASR